MILKDLKVCDFVISEHLLTSSRYYIFSPLSHHCIVLLFFSFFLWILFWRKNAHGLALKFSQNHGNLENYKHRT